MTNPLTNREKAYSYSRREQEKKHKEFVTAQRQRVAKWFVFSGTSHNFVGHVYAPDRMLAEIIAYVTYGHGEYKVTADC